MKVFQYILVLLITFTIFKVDASQVPRKKKKRKKKHQEKELQIVPIPNVLSQEQLNSFSYSFSEGLRRKSLGQIDKASLKFVQCLMIDSTSSACYYELANIALITKNINDALRFSRKAVFYNPKNKWYLQQLASIFKQKGMISHATNTYDKLKTIETDNLKYYLAKAILLVSVEEWEKALQEIALIEENFGIFPKISLQKLSIYSKMGKKDLAYKEMGKLINKFPKNVDFIGLLADMYNEDNMSEKAFEQYQKILKIEPNNGLVHFYLSEYYRNKKNYEKALDEFEIALTNKEIDPYLKLQRLATLGEDTIVEQEKLLYFTGKFVAQNPEINRGRLLYAYLLKAEDKEEEAQKELFLILEKDSTNYQALQQLASIYLESKSYDSLKSLTKSSIRYYPEDPWFYLFDGFANMYLEHFVVAEKSLLKGKNFIRNNENLLLQFNSTLADNYYKMGNKQKAFVMFEKILLLDPDNIIILNNYSYYLSLEKEKLFVAERMSQKCINKEPTNSTYLDTYAWVLYASGKYTEAKEYMEKAIENMDENNQSGVILEHYGDILFKLGELERAVEYWEKGFKIGSDNNSLLQQKILRRDLLEKD